MLLLQLSSFYCADASQPSSQSVGGTSYVLMRTLAGFFVCPKPFLFVWVSTCQCLIFTRIHSTHFSKPNVFSSHLSQEICVPHMLFACSVCQDFKPHQADVETTGMNSWTIFRVFSEQFSGQFSAFFCCADSCLRCSNISRQVQKISVLSLR